MYFVITNSKIYAKKDIKALKKVGLAFETTDFKPLGSDYILTLSDENFEYVKDLNKISSIPMSLLFKGENTGKLIQYAILAVTILTLLKK